MLPATTTTKPTVGLAGAPLPHSPTQGLDTVTNPSVPDSILYSSATPSSAWMSKSLRTPQPDIVTSSSILTAQTVFSYSWVASWCLPTAWHLPGGACEKCSQTLCVLPSQEAMPSRGVDRDPHSNRTFPLCVELRICVFWSAVIDKKPAPLK